MADTAHRGADAGHVVVDLVIDHGWPEGEERWRPLMAQALAAAAAEAGALLPPPPWEVAVLLADDACLRALNARFCGLDRPTDILSFPDLRPREEGEGSFLGDIAMARSAVEAGARMRGAELGAHVRHLCVHGLFHLAGLDHEDAGAAARMEALEVRALARLGVADPYGAAA